MRCGRGSSANTFYVGQSPGNVSGGYKCRYPQRFPKFLSWTGGATSKRGKERKKRKRGGREEKTRIKRKKEAGENTPGSNFWLWPWKLPIHRHRHRHSATHVYTAHILSLRHWSAATFLHLNPIVNLSSTCKCSADMTFGIAKRSKPAGIEKNWNLNTGCYWHRPTRKNIAVIH